MGLAAEWAWTNVWMPIPWNAELLPEGAVLGLLAAVAGALVGAWVGERLASDELPRTARDPIRRAGGRAGHLRDRGVRPTTSPPRRASRGQVTLAEAGRRARSMPTVRLRPADAAEDAEFATVTAWQGGGLCS